MDLFPSEHVDFRAVLAYLDEYEGEEVLSLISGPDDDSPAIVRVSGKLGPLTVVDEGRIDPEDDNYAVPSFEVGDTLISMHATEFMGAEWLPLEHWLVIKQRHATIEFRFPGEG